MFENVYFNPARSENNIDPINNLINIAPGKMHTMPRITMYLTALWRQMHYQPLILRLHDY
jgi:hypothetical protein